MVNVHRVRRENGGRAGFRKAGASIYTSSEEKLRGRRSAGRGIVEEKLVMEGGKKRRNVARYQEWGMKQENRSLRNRAKVGGLADLAGRFVLTIFVGMGSELGKKNNEHQRQTER